jgi:hypothetical protein
MGERCQDHLLPPRYVMTAPPLTVTTWRRVSCRAGALVVKLASGVHALPQDDRLPGHAI